ncbi:MAG: CDP-alcohol phosphatidyltransferase family protein [Erysipelotrichaceae bacterium]
MKIERKEIFSIPNILSYIRLILIPVFVYLYVKADNINGYVLPTIILAIAGFTDFLDGFIARKFNMITTLGKMIDPIADKLLQLAIAIALLSRYDIMLVLIIVLVVKEGMMAICGIILLKKDMRLDGAKWFGKVSTAVFYVLMVVLVVAYEMPILYANMLIIVTIGFMLFSFVMYIPVYMEMFKKN